jgi:hypothetical protein
MPGPQTVHLGDSDFLIVAQRHAYLRRRLSAVIDSLTGSEVEGAGGIMELVGSRMYEVLAAFIPNFMPRWKYEGFASQGAMEAGEYDEAHDASPTFEEQFNAISVALEVNGLNRLRALGNVVSPELIRALIAEQIANVATARSQSGSSSQSANGAPPLTTSSPTSPT